MDSVFQKISCSNISPEKLVVAYKLLLKLLNNIIENSTISKYRTIRSSNPTILSELFLNGEAEGKLFEELLLTIGFEPSPEGFTYIRDQNIEDLSNYRDIIQGVLHSINSQNDENQTVHNEGDSPNSNKKESNLLPLRRRENREIDKGAAELNAIRAEHAKKFQSNKNNENSNDSSSSSSSTSSGNINRNNGGIFDFFWRRVGGSGDSNVTGSNLSSADRRRNNERNNRGRRVMTLNDVRSPRTS